jgi:hypothetical protein
MNWTSNSRPIRLNELDRLAVPAISHRRNPTMAPANFKKMLTLSIFLMASIASTSSFAQSSPPPSSTNTPYGYCDPAVAKKMVEQFKAVQSDQDATFEPLLKHIKKVVEQSMVNLSACVDLSWPSMKISYPTMDMIIRGIAQGLQRKACSVARDAISEQTSKLNGSFYFNTRIPGVPDYGISTSGTGGGDVTWGAASTGTYGGTPAPSGSAPTQGAPPPSGNPTGGLFNPPPPPTQPKP